MKTVFDLVERMDELREDGGFEIYAEDYKMLATLEMRV
jgi:hypothetical protein